MALASGRKLSPTHLRIVGGSANDGHGWSVGDTRNPLLIIELGHGGQGRTDSRSESEQRSCPQGEGHGRPESIEPSTRGIFQYGPDLSSKGGATAPTRCLRPAVPLAERYCHVLESVVFHFAQVSDAGL